MSNFTDVDDFLHKFQLKPCDSSSIRLMEKRGSHISEELREFIEASVNKDLHGMVDALIDLVYVAYGTASMLGLSEEQWNECFKRVHEANMNKYLDKDDTSHKVGVKKPLGWQAPNFEDIMKEVRGEV